MKRNVKGQFTRGLTPWNKGKRTKKTCEGCSEVFVCRPGTAKKTRFCSRSCAKKGNSWNRGRKRSSEFSKKISKAKTNKPRPDMEGNTFRAGLEPWNKGLDGYGNPNLGKWAKEHRGEKSPSWKGGITEPDRLERIRFRNEIQRQVFERDDYTCQLCGERGGDLQVDHIQPWSEYVELRFSMDNCRTLCMGCHYEITYGKPMPKTIKAWGHNLGRRNQT